MKTLIINVFQSLVDAFFIYWMLQGFHWWKPEEIPLFTGLQCIVFVGAVRGACVGEYKEDKL